MLPYPAKKQWVQQSVCSTIGCLVLGASLKMHLIFLYARFRVHNRIMDQRPETVDRSIKRNMRASQQAAENAKFSAIVSG